MNYRIVIIFLIHTLSYGIQECPFLCHYLDKKKETYETMLPQATNLEIEPQTIVVKQKQIIIAEYPHAFNASMVKWHDKILMSFRDIPNPQSLFTSNVGLIWLDENFEPLGKAHILDTRTKWPGIPPRIDDARLLSVEDRIFIVYSDNIDEKITRGGFRVHIAELFFDGTKFSLGDVDRITDFEEETIFKREKNWTPFDYHGKLLLAYSINPLHIFEPLGKGVCKTISTSQATIDKDWGEIRGGTPALLIDGSYISFFHSVKRMSSYHSQGKNILHYFIGAYMYTPEPPFTITHISKKPIIAKGFYSGIRYKPYWFPACVVFPCGIIDDKDFIWVSYGRQDHEVWVMALDKKALRENMINLQKI